MGRWLEEKKGVHWRRRETDNMYIYKRARERETEDRRGERAEQVEE